MSDSLSHFIAELAHQVAPRSLFQLADKIEADQSWSLTKHSLLSYLGRGQVQNTLNLLLDQIQDDNRESVALALRTAAAIGEQSESGQKLELVWTGPKSKQATRQTEQVIQEVIQSSKETLWMVSYATYSIYSFRNDLHEALQRGVNVNLILENKIEKKGGRLNDMGKNAIETLDKAKILNYKKLNCYIWAPYLRKKKENKKGEEYIVDSLHAKCSLADHHKMFITSANLTSTAMKNNMELGILVTGGKEPKKLSQHFTSLTEEDIIVRLRMD